MQEDTTIVKQFDVFLSYTSDDKAQVAWYARQLSSCGLTCWLDSDRIAPGESIQGAMAKGIEASRCVAVMIGPRIGSYMTGEAEFAIDLAYTEGSVRVFAVLLPTLPAGFDLKREIPFLSQRSWVDLRGIDDGDRAAQLLERAVRSGPLDGLDDDELVVFPGLSQPALSTTRQTQSSGAAPHPVRRWEPGAELAVGSQRYLLHDYLLSEIVASDQSTIFRQGRGYRIDSPASSDEGMHVWLRQVVIRDRRSKKGSLQALERERELLAELQATPNLPAIVNFENAGEKATLAVSWPTSRNGAQPRDSLDALCGPAMDDPWIVDQLLSGFSHLAAALAALHGAGHSHRLIGPDNVVTVDDRTLTVRDLGLASTEPRTGEGANEYQAPEQRRRNTQPPGPATDVYRLAATIRHVLVGHPPLPINPPPLARLTSLISDELATVLDDALAAEPRHRPSLGAVRASLRAGRGI